MVTGGRTFRDYFQCLKLPFRDLIGRVREREPDAARELVERYKGAIRRVVRIRMRDTRLRQLLDSTDLCRCWDGGNFCVADGSVRTIAYHVNKIMIGSGPMTLLEGLASKGDNELVSDDL